MEGIVEEVINDVSWELTTMLEDYIKMFTYRFEYYPNSVYHNKSHEPTYEFLRAWKWSKIRKEVKSMFMEMQYDSSDMRYDPKTWLHGSYSGDARENLADILNVTGYTSSLMAPSGTRLLSKLRMPYWDLYIEALFSRGKLNQMFDKEFRRFGIKRVK
jgi:hypothetical protein